MPFLWKKPHSREKIRFASKRLRRKKANCFTEKRDSLTPFKNSHSGAKITSTRRNCGVTKDLRRIVRRKNEAFSRIGKNKVNPNHVRLVKRGERKRREKGKSIFRRRNSQRSSAHPSAQGGEEAIGTKSETTPGPSPKKGEKVLACRNSSSSREKKVYRREGN